MTYASVVSVYLLLAKGRAATSSRTARIPSYSKNVTVAPPPAKVSAPGSAGASKISTPSNVVSTSNAMAMAKVAINNIGTHSASSSQEGRRSIYIERLPFDIDRQGILEVVTKFGPVGRSPQSIQIRRHKDGFCCGLVEFESVDYAGRAVEARGVNFGEKQATSHTRDLPIKGRVKDLERGNPISGAPNTTRLTHFWQNLSPLL
ncbi:hypothetical protein Sango_1091200 [Sesamum angolense]|uniref:RRM domain-containing protein n=1 Tax=Sesamum angolense TaxID=2727404 RepID=A0AAE1WUV1_9LAMI|nr:hypothetical protein Sango_1091200 [Sesamum angolense]